MTFYIKFQILLKNTELLQLKITTSYIQRINWKKCPMIHDRVNMIVKMFININLFFGAFLVTMGSYRNSGNAPVARDSRFLLLTKK